MTPSTEKEYRDFYKAKFGEGVWRWVAFLVIYFLSAISGLYIGRWFGAPPSSPGADPPWYFVRQDFFQGVGSLAGMVAVLSVVALTWRRHTFTNWMLVMFVGIWMVPSVVTAIIIYSRCGNFFDYEHAVCAWPTFDAYSKSGVKFAGIPVGFVIAMAIAGPVAWKRFRERRKLR